MEDIHGKDVSQLVANNSELINNNRAIFESNNFITEMIKQLEKEADDDDDDVDECEEHLHLRPTGSEGYIHEDALPILPITRPFEVTDSGNNLYIRRQFALTLAQICKKRIP